MQHSPKARVLDANQERLIYVYQGPKGWGKGVSIKIARANYKKFNRTTSGKGVVSIYMVTNDDTTKEEALKEIQISDMNITYATPNIILLAETEVK